MQNKYKLRIQNNAFKTPNVGGKVRLLLLFLGLTVEVPHRKRSRTLRLLFVALGCRRRQIRRDHRINAHGPWWRCHVDRITGRVV